MEDPSLVLHPDFDPDKPPSTLSSAEGPAECSGKMALLISHLFSSPANESVAFSESFAGCFQRKGNFLHTAMSGTGHLYSPLMLLHYNSRQPQKE